MRGAENSLTGPEQTKKGRRDEPGVPLMISPDDLWAGTCFYFFGADLAALTVTEVATFWPFSTM